MIYYPNTGNLICINYYANRVCITRYIIKRVECFTPFRIWRVLRTDSCLITNQFLNKNLHKDWLLLHVSWMTVCVRINIASFETPKLVLFSWLKINISLLLRSVFIFVRLISSVGSPNTFLRLEFEIQARSSNMNGQTYLTQSLLLFGILKKFTFLRNSQPKIKKRLHLIT